MRLKFKRSQFNKQKQETTKLISFFFWFLFQYQMVLIFGKLLQGGKKRINFLTYSLIRIHFDQVYVLREFMKCKK